MRRVNLTAVSLGCMLTLAINGCNGPESSPVESATAPVSEAVDAHDHADHDGHGDKQSADSDSAMAQKMSGLKELSAEDYQSAMAQHTCPVSGEMLGSMGAPEKVEVNGQAVWICCNGCRDKLLADPEKYLAKMQEGQAGE